MLIPLFPRPQSFQSILKDEAFLINRSRHLKLDHEEQIVAISASHQIQMFQAQLTLMVMKMQSFELLVRKTLLIEPSCVKYNQLLTLTQQRLTLQHQSMFTVCS